MPTATLTPDVSRRLHLRVEAVAETRRCVSAVVATENPADVFDNRTGQIISEVLLLDGCQVVNRVPLLSDHIRSVQSTVGSASSFKRDGGELRAVLTFAHATAGADEAWALVSQRHLTGVSVGYRVIEYQGLRPGETKTIGGRIFTAKGNRPLRVTTRWQIKEISLCPVGADEKSGIRSDIQNTFTRNSEMSVINTLPDVRNMRFVDYLAAGMSQRGQQRGENDADTVRAALSHVEGVADMASLVNQSILTGFRSENDTTAGWTRAVDLPNFLAADIAAVDVAPRLGRIARGGTAPVVGFGISKQGWRLARFAAQFVIDEQDMIDGGNIGVYQTALEEIGRASRRVLPDMIYSMLLTNAALDDGTAIFHADRNNTATAALADAALDAGMAAVGNQVLADSEGDPVHQNLEARYAIVPPALLGTAKRLARDLATGSGDLIVRSENRLGAAGVIDPNTDSIVTGSTTNWLLFCPSTQTAGVVVGSLYGNLEPSVRHYTLDGAGEYGLGFDVKLDVAATVLNPKAMYRSTGAA